MPRRPITKLVPLQKKLNRNRYRARPAKPLRELRQR
jgi:hypothetical protein